MEPFLTQLQAGQLKAVSGILGAAAGILGGVAAGLGLVLSIDGSSQIAQGLAKQDFGS